MPTRAVPAVEDATRAVAVPPVGSFIISAGTDRRIRYWDLQDPSRSFVVVGAGDRDGGGTKTAVRYAGLPAGRGHWPNNTERQLDLPHTHAARTGA